MEINYAVYSTLLGNVRISSRGETLVGVTLLSVDEQVDDRGCRTDFLDKVFYQLQEYIDGSRKQFTISFIFEKATDFQKLVWLELLKIPYGKTMTYGEIARRIGRPLSARAVGMACNRNPLHLIVPCHRVVGSKGSLVGYAAGLELKQRLLDCEV